MTDWGAGFCLFVVPTTQSGEQNMDMMELDGLAQNVDALFGIAGLKEDLMDVAVLGASAGDAVVGG